MSVATATPHPFTLVRMASDRALPPAQNDELRRRLRELVTAKYEGAIGQAAKALGVSHATISDVLAGKRGVGQKLLDGMANVTGQSLDVLLGRRVELDPAPTRDGDQLGQHPTYMPAEQDMRAKHARRGIVTNEEIVTEIRTARLSRPRAVVTADFLMRLYDAIMQDHEDNSEV